MSRWIDRLLARMPLRDEIAMTLDAEERRLVIRSAVIGVVVWAMVAALEKAVHLAFETTMHLVAMAPTPLVVFAPLLAGALMMAGFLRWGTKAIHYRDDDGSIHELIDVEGDGLERGIALYYTSEPTLEQALLGRRGVDARWDLPTFSLAIRKFLATLVTLGTGGSGGLEASVTLIGESTAAGLLKPRRPSDLVRTATSPLGALWRWWRSSDPDDLQTAQLGGIAAAVSTLLGAPFAAAFFATEVMYRRRPIIGKLVYSLIPALVAFFLNNVYVGHAPMFAVPAATQAPASPRYYAALVGMSFAVAIVATLFSQLRRSVTQQLHRVRSPVMRLGAGALVTGGLAVGVALWAGGELSDVLGPGQNVIQAALDAELDMRLAAVLLVAKMIATLATIGAGGSAGLLIPATYFGTMVAVIVAQALHLPPAMFVVPAITASLISIVNVPLAAILLVVEMFGSEFMVPAMITLVAASIFSNRVSIYRTQREQHDRREILPGFGVRRIVVPEMWSGRSLFELEFRRTYGLSVVGIFESTEQGSPKVRLDPRPDAPLRGGDVLVVIGTEAKLESFARAITDEDAAFHAMASTDGTG